jgi:hypothetical protein
MCAALYYLMQIPMPRVIEARLIPTSTFISDAQARMTAPDPRANSVMQGTLAKKLIAMEKEKNKAIKDQKIAVLEAKYAAQVKKAEEQARKKLNLEKKKTQQAQEIARDATVRKEQRRYEAELNRKSRIEPKKIIAVIKRKIAEKRKKEAHEKNEMLKKHVEADKAAKRARYSQDLRETEVIKPLLGTEGVVDVPVQEAPLLQK